MSVPLSQPTPYHDVNSILDQVLSKLQIILQGHFIGLYLGGSLALGDFNPDRSDVDFVVVTADELPPELVAAVEEMHTQLWFTGAKWAKKFDGSYVPQPVIRHWTPDHPPCPFIERDTFTITQQGSAVIQRHIIHQYGIVVAGPHPHMLLDPVEADELLHALRDMLERWWRPLLDDPGWVQQSQMQPFALLSMCRALYTLEHGIVAPKLVAGRWCQQTLGIEWTPLIEWAMAWPRDTDSNQLAATLRLIQYTLNRYEHL